MKASDIPNLITGLRILLVLPVAWLMIEQRYGEALLIFAVAGGSDALDGFLAKRFNWTSWLGGWLDPLADKLLVMATLIWMVPMGRISDWVVILLLAREISITGLRSIASSEGVVIAAGGGGKSKTALQMVGILCLVIGYPYHLDIGIYDLGVVDLVPVGRWLVYISLVFSFGSGFEYVRLFAEAVEAKERRQGPQAEN